SSHLQVRTQEHVPVRRYRSNRRVLRAKRVCSSATRVARRPLTAHLREAYRCLRRRYATWLARTRGIASEQKSPRHRDSPNEAQSTLSHQRHTWSPEKVLSPYVRLGRALLARPFASCLVQDFLPDHRLTPDRSRLRYRHYQELMGTVPDQHQRLGLASIRRRPGHRHCAGTSSYRVRTGDSFVRRSCHRARREHGRENTQIRAVQPSVEGSGYPKLGRSAGTGRAFLHARPMPCRTHRHWWGRHCPGSRTQESCWVRIIVALEGSDQSASV